MLDDDPRVLIAQLRHLREEYALYAVHGNAATASSRGQWFNGFLARLLRLHGIDAYDDQHGLDRRDEIDVFFRLAGYTFLLEAKWTKQKIDVGPVVKLAERLRVRPHGAYGVLVSMAGYTPAVLDRARHQPDVLLLEREHVEALLSGLITPADLFKGLLEHTGLRGGATAALADLLRPIKAPELPSWVPADAPDAPTMVPVIEHAAPGVEVIPLITTTGPWFSPWSGMTRDGASLLLTCDDGIAEVNPADGDSSWVHTVPGCLGALLRRDRQLLAVRGHGVIALGPGRTITPIAGPLDRHAQLLDGPGGPYAFTTTGPPGPVYRGTHLLTRLHESVGEDETLALDFAGQIYQAAVLQDGALYVAGGYYGGLVAIGADMTIGEQDRFRAAPLAELCALLPISGHRILSAGRAGAGGHAEIHVTDLRTRDSACLLRLTGGRPIALVATERPGSFHLLHTVHAKTSVPCAMLLQVNLPL